MAINNRKAMKDRVEFKIDSPDCEQGKIIRGNNYNFSTQSAKKAIGVHVLVLNNKIAAVSYLSNILE